MTQPRTIKPGDVYSLGRDPSIYLAVTVAQSSVQAVNTHVHYRYRCADDAPGSESTMSWHPQVLVHVLHFNTRVHVHPGTFPN